MTEIFNQSAQKQFRRDLRKRMPKAEAALWIYLKGKQLGGVKFRRQFSVGKYIVDFYCPKHKVVIEIDGDSHFVSAGAMRCDIDRQKYIESLGLRVLRFTNLDILKNLYGVLCTIKKELLTSPTPPSQGGDN